MGAKKWIQKAGIKSGALHETLGIPQDEKIPEARVEAAAHSNNPKERRQGILAETFAHIRPKATERFAHHPHGRENAHGMG